MPCTPSHVQNVRMAPEGKRLMESRVARCGESVLCPNVALWFSVELVVMAAICMANFTQEDPVHQVLRVPRSQPRIPLLVPVLQSSQQATVAPLLI